MPLPKIARIGGRTYTIKIAADTVSREALIGRARKGLYGFCDNDTFEIFLHPDNGKERQQDTVLHEILHAAVNYAGINRDLTDEQEESIVNRLAPILLGALKDPKNRPVWTYLSS